jgi:hypothetical protein
MSWLVRQSGDDDAKFARQMLEHLALVEAPDAVWRSIEAAMDAPRIAPPRPRAPLWPRWALAAIATIALLAAGYWRLARQQWIETGADSGVTLRIGQIGTVEVGPHTRLRIIADRPEEHRLALAHGGIHAKISAPPRLFFVDTAAGTAIDLGCEYSLVTDDAGAGVLRVTRGWVSFQWRGRESLVPAGAMCLTKAHSGPGIPYFEDASDNLKQAADGAMNLDVILAEARVRDTLTLWHLLSRMAETDRGRVYDRIAALTPVPAGVSREKVLLLDPEALKGLKEELAWTW